MADLDASSSNRRRRDVTRSHQTQSKALDQMGDEEDVHAELSRREARALRLEARRKQIEEEEQAKIHAKDYEAYKVALDAAKERAAQRRAKLTHESSKSNQEQDNLSLIEEIQDVCATIMKGPDRENESVQVLHQRVLLLSTRLRTSVEYGARMQTNRVHAQYERETLRDSLDESQEETSKLQAQLRKEKDGRQAKIAELIKAQRRIAELEDALANAAPAEGDEAMPTRSAAAVVHQDDEEKEKLQRSNTDLARRVRELEEQLSTVKHQQISNGDTGLDNSLDMAHVDPQVAAQRMKSLETQKKRIKQELAEAEEREEALRNDKRKLAREVRQQDGQIHALQDQLAAKDEQLKKLRERRRRNVSLLED